ncbi:MAG TPA: hypothetical protein VNZ49_05975 [Bacteroidia bacterium]|jgi:hypothetical protein|nr:hypothetical protein [Bacteroidia bacterium]
MKKVIFSVISLVLLLSSCQGGSSNADTGKKTVENKDSLKKQDSTPVVKVVNTPGAAWDINTYAPENNFNAIASVMSGVKTNTGNLKRFLDSAAWRDNARFVDSSWKRLESSRLSKMRDWRDVEFAQINKNSKTIFYPFSGPDFLTAYTFFPDADKYVLIGLENIGKLPDVSKMKKKEAEDYVYGFRNSLTDIFNKSYFITKNMGRDFNYHNLYGTLSLMSFFIKRTGNEIANVKYVVKYNNDSIAEVPYDYKDKEHKAFGVRIDIVSNGKPKTVYYFRYDVSDKKFNDTAVFYKYLSKMTDAATYIKSASYLLHNDFMSNMRKFILDKTNYVVEDDTGIPFKYFTKDSKWDIKLYGAYAKPVSDFKWLNKQEDLNEAYQKDSTKIGKLSFHLGYHWGSKKDVLIVAGKK